MNNEKKERDNLINILKNNNKYLGEPKGDEQSICSVCGEFFQQFLKTSTNSYTTFKMCPKCRANKRKKVVTNKTNENEEMLITLDFTPHSSIQSEMYYDEHRFNVYNCGSRFGKDRLSVFKLIAYFIQCLNEYRPTSLVPTVYMWLIAPTERMAKQNWSELKKYMPRQLIEQVHNSEMSMETVYGGLIEVRSAYDPEALVGVGLDGVVITEASRINDLDIVWANIEQRLNSPGRGINGKGGFGILNSSPKGKNYFYRIWQWGQENNDNYDPDWKSWTATTWDNPEMDKRGKELKPNKRGELVSYKERLKKRLGKRRYDQDILAKFLGGTNPCFPDFDVNCVVKIPENLSKQERLEYIKQWQEPLGYMKYKIGYDPASINDEPPLVIKEANGKRIVKLVNMAGKGWNSQYDTIAYYSQKYNNATCVFSKTGHETIAEELEKRGIIVETLNEQGSNKENMVINLEGIVQSGELEILDDESDEFKNYQDQMNDYSAVLQKNNKNEYKNIEETHDDWVSATYVVFYSNDENKNILPSLAIIDNIMQNNGILKLLA